MSGRFRFDKVILFGSAADGKMREDSDVDLVIVSKNFEGKKFHERPVELYLKWDLDVPVDFLCFTPKEFNEKKGGVNIVSHALKHGISIS